MLRRGDIEAARARHVGDAQAGAAFNSGNAWAGAIRGIGEQIGAMPGQMQQAKRQGLQDQVLSGQVADMTRARAGGQAVAGMMRGDQLPANDAGPRQESYLDANGLFDVPKITASLGKSGYGDLAPELVRGAENINDSILKHQDLEQKVAQQHSVLLGDLADGALKMAKGGTPLLQAMDFVVQPALATKRIKPEDYAQVKQQIAQLPPAQQQHALTALMDQAAKLGGETTLAEGATRKDRYGRTVGTGGEKPPTEAELALKAAGGDPAAIKAMALLKPTPNRTAEQDDQKYRDIVARGTQHQPVAPEEAAWALAYEKQKTLGVDKSASAAATRLASVQAQQNDLQKRAQGFTEAQAGRKELTEKVELPYLDAVEKAETMRSVIAAAKSGNQEAAALTPLLATLGVTTAEGVKRINMAEIATVSGAGSLLERIKGKIGKVVSGQPLAADLQDDIVKLADLLENSARKKYEQGFQTITSRYGLKDESIRQRPEATATPSAPIKVGGFTVVVK